MLQPITRESTTEAMLAAYRDLAHAWQGLQHERYQTRAQRFRAIAAEAHRDWRLGCIPPRWGDSAVFIFREGIADIARMRLWLAYMPLFQALERIERRYGILADMRVEPWAAANHWVNRITL
jgi:hypothetical protein